MLQLQEQSLTNIAYYKTAKLVFKPGITAILGNNVNARIAGATNAAGKSSLFTPLHSALGYNTPLIRGRQGSKDLFGSRTSEASLTFKRGKSVYQAVRKGNKFTVFRDGKDLGLRTQALALEKLAELRLLTETQFYSTVYLDSSRPHTFQSGSSSDRLNFFTDLFDLHDVDTVRSYCRSLMTDAADAEKEVQRITAELAALTVLDTTELEEQLKKEVRMQDRCQTVTRTYAAMKHRLDLLERDAQLQAKIVALQKQVGDDKAGPLKAQLRAVRDYATATATHTSWDKRRRTLLAEVRELQATVGALSLKDARAALQVQEKLSNIEKPEEPECKRVTLDDPQSVLKTSKAKRERLLAKNRDLKESVDGINEHGTEHDGNCPLCGTQLDRKFFTKLLASLEEHITENTKKARALGERIASAEAAIAWVAYDKLAVAYAKEASGYSAVVHKRLRQYVRALEAYGSHKQSEPRVASKPVNGDEDDLQQRLDRCARLTTLLEQPRAPSETQSEVESFARANGLQFDIPLLRTYIGDHEEKAVAKLRNLNASIPKLKSSIDMAKADAKRARFLTKQMAEKTEGARDLPVLKMLVDAYSKSGIKSLIVTRLAKAIETNMNRLASIVFREPFKFELIVNGINFHVIAHRKNMGKPMVSDVRMLSGAERRMFILLFLLSTLPLLPAGKRYDTLVLDEPFANLDVPNIEMLRDRLLPKLRKVVPKLVIIVTQADHIPAGARVFTAVKSNGVSTLKEGL